MKKWLIAIVPIAIFGIVFAIPSQEDKPFLPFKAPPVVVQEQPKAVVTISAQEIIDLVNDYRVKNGLSSLVLSPELTASATEKCEDMLARVPDAMGVHHSYYAHVNPLTGVRGLDIAKREYPNASYWGENLAGATYATSQEPVTAWINSPEHLSNIVGNYNVTGVAVCTFGPADSIYLKRFVVQHFAN